MTRCGLRGLIGVFGTSHSYRLTYKEIENIERILSSKNSSEFTMNLTENKLSKKIILYVYSTQPGTLIGTNLHFRLLLIKVSVRPLKHLSVYSKENAIKSQCCLAISYN